MQELNKKKKRSSSKSTSLKNKRVQLLEQQVKELQQQISNQENVQSLINTQNSTQSLRQLKNSSYSSRQKENVPQNYQANSKDASKDQSIDLPRKVNEDKRILDSHVSVLEEKLKKFNSEVNFNNSDQSYLRDQIKLQMQENEQLRSTYNQSYQEMMSTFNQFKQEMEKKHHILVQDYQQRFDSIRSNYELESQNKERMIGDLKKENVFLRQKIDRIRDVFDYQRSHHDIELLNIQINEDSFKRQNELQPFA